MWIDVNTRLPKDSKDVIVWDKKEKCFREDYYIKDDGEAGWAKSNQDSISHWMPVGLFNKLISKIITPS